MKNHINKYIENLKIENQRYDNNKEEILKHTYSIVKNLLNLQTIICLIMTIVCLLNSYYDDHFILYVTMTLLFLGLRIFLITKKNKENSIPILNLSYFILTVYIIVNNFVYMVDTNNVVIIAVLIVIPYIVTNKRLKVNASIIGLSLIYIISVLTTKEGQLLNKEIISVTMFSITAILLGNQSRSSKLENYELKRLMSISEITDELTQLPNRRKIFRDLNDLPFKAIAILDIDRFKQYNDNYGHPAGDECLKKVAEAFRTFEKIYDVKTYRYGGEEFFMIIKDTEKENPLKICKALNQHIEDLKIEHLYNEYKVVTISCGCTLYRKGATNTKNSIQKLLDEADDALYKAKIKRNQSEMYKKNNQ